MSEQVSGRGLGGVRGMTKTRKHLARVCSGRVFARGILNVRYATQDTKRLKSKKNIVFSSFSGRWRRLRGVRERPERGSGGGPGGVREGSERGPRSALNGSEVVLCPNRARELNKVCEPCEERGEF